MQNCFISAVVTKTDIGTVDLNGFIYNVVEVDIAQLHEFKVFIPVFADVDVGTIFTSTTWAVTRYKTEDSETLALRIDNLDIVDKYEPIEYLTAKVTGMFVNSDKCKLKYVGPTRRAFYRCTLKLKDEFKESFSILLCGFKDNALKLSTLTRMTIIQAEVCIRDKRYEDGYELCINHFQELVKEN